MSTPNSVPTSFRDAGTVWCEADLMCSEFCEDVSDVAICVVLGINVQSSETKLREIDIGFVNDDHYVQVHLSPDHPIPPISRMLHEQSDICNVTHLYSRTKRVWMHFNNFREWRM
ncbi:hypothetical protein L3X38_018233 [Prunus dulcis]|uniref:Uncharacterized protein n=1 Tax=Prunus dulcis TaxID=3755 RepID=A0AAD4ZAU0_PRUDU|nr:hypothetical protein L3X38_018233 [Prunus dulcis]